MTQLYGTAARCKPEHPTVAEHRGRIVKTTGDGALLEFASAVDVVRRASEIQIAMAKRNAEAAEDHRLEFRIGIDVEMSFWMTGTFTACDSPFSSA